MLRTQISIRLTDSKSNWRNLHELSLLQQINTNWTSSSRLRTSSLPLERANLRLRTSSHRPSETYIKTRRIQVSSCFHPTWSQEQSQQFIRKTPRISTFRGLTALTSRSRPSWRKKKTHQTTLTQRPKATQVTSSRVMKKLNHVAIKTSKRLNGAKTRNLSYFLHLTICIRQYKHSTIHRNNSVRLISTLTNCLIHIFYQTDSRNYRFTPPKRNTTRHRRRWVTLLTTAIWESHATSFLSLLITR